MVNVVLCGNYKSIYFRLFLLTTYSFGHQYFHDLYKSSNLSRLDTFSKLYKEGGGYLTKNNKKYLKKKKSIIIT